MQIYADTPVSEVRWSMEAKVFHTLSDDTRIWLIRELAKGDATVQDLTQRFNEEVGEMDYSNMLRHLKVLENLGMTKPRKAKDEPYGLRLPMTVEFHVAENGKWDYRLCWGKEKETPKGKMHEVHHEGSST